MKSEDMKKVVDIVKKARLSLLKGGRSTHEIKQVKLHWCTEIIRTLNDVDPSES